MSLLKKAKVNKVSKDLSNYYYLIQGVQKSGKTTFARDFILEECDSVEEGLLLAIGKEKGYKALDNIQAIDIESWKDFEAIIKELVTGKGKEHNIKYVFIDTYDELIPLAEKEIMRLSTIATGKPCKSFNAAFGGYGAPRVELRKLVTEKLDILNDNFGLMVIGHTKLKTIKEQGMLEDQEYQILSSNLNADYHSIVAHKADVIATVIQEREINEKRVQETKTNIYFRGNGFVEAGSRFKNIQEKVEFNAKNFIEVIKNAIKETTNHGVVKRDVKQDVQTEIPEVKEVEINIEQAALNIKQAVDQMRLDLKEQSENRVVNIIEEEIQEPIEQEEQIQETNEELFAKIRPLYTKAEKDIKLKVKKIIESYGYSKFEMTADNQMFVDVFNLLNK